MSSKSDRDNRSNQLNPNNSAYSSSRGIGNYDDDEGEYYVSPSWVGTSFSGHSLVSPDDQRIKIYKQFTFDFMSMSGLTAHLKATVEFSSKFSCEPKCTDVIEKKLQLRLREEFEQITNSPIALLQVRDADGRELKWLGEEYRPCRISKKLDLEEQQRVRCLNELWSQSTKSKVQDFKKSLRDYESLPREDLGFIVTHQSLNKTFQWV